MHIDPEIDLNTSKTIGIIMSIKKTQMSTRFLRSFFREPNYKNRPAIIGINSMVLIINSFKYISYTQRRQPSSIICPHYHHFKRQLTDF